MRRILWKELILTITLVPSISNAAARIDMPLLFERQLSTS